MPWLVFRVSFVLDRIPYLNIVSEYYVQKIPVQIGQSNGNLYVDVALCHHRFRFNWPM